VSAKAAEVTDQRGENHDAPYPFSDVSMNLAAESSGLNDRNEFEMASSSASFEVTYEYVTAPVLARFSGSGGLAAEADGGFASSFAIVQTHLLVEVSEGDAAYVFDGALSGDSENRSGMVLDERNPDGGWFTPAIFEHENSAFSTSGTLTPGIYRVRLFSRVGSTAESGAKEAAPSFDFRLVSGTP
jgi:hypothetical protein